MLLSETPLGALVKSITVANISRSDAEMKETAALARSLAADALKKGDDINMVGIISMLVNQLMLSSSFLAEDVQIKKDLRQETWDLRAKISDLELAAMRLKLTPTRR